MARFWYFPGNSLAAQTQIKWVDPEREADSEEMGKPAMVGASAVLLIVCGLTYCVASCRRARTRRLRRDDCSEASCQYVRRLDLKKCFYIS